jgi:ATP-dependent RNA helicase DDX52/ROK1
MMDLFKLLSRSTKLSGKQTASRNEHKLPSSGQNANPQLFGKRNTIEGDEDAPVAAKIGGVTVLGKRKRKGVAGINVPTELDFFAEGANSGGKSNGSEIKPVDNVSKRHYAKEGEDKTRHVLSEEERRAILKAHKIKIMVLEDVLQHGSKSTPKNTMTKSKWPHATEIKQRKRQIYPLPLTSFSQLRPRYSLSRRLTENVEAQGYKTPTEVQLAALPILMDGEQTPSCDLLTVAPTGSGKTLAFLIPVINAILRDDTRIRDDRVQAIVLAPTRELAHQIVNEGKKLLLNTGIRITLMRKSMRLTERDDLQFEEISNSGDDTGSEKANVGRKDTTKSIVKAHIIVATPLVLVNSLDLRSGYSTGLAHIRHLVLDEADVLLDPLFRDQVEAIWNACTSSDLRISLWSATMASSIEDFAMKQFANLGHTGRVPIIRLVVGLKDTALPTLTHTVTYTGTEAGKLLALRQLLHPTAPDTDAEGRKSLRPPFLVFTQTIERAKALQAELRYDIPPEAGGSARMAALHSEMSDNAREKIMAAFRKGEIWVLITTDLLARGVDFRGLNGVVNYDVPTSAAAYVHRVGRTGRAGREGGVAVTFYTKEDIPYVKPIANVIAASEKLRPDGQNVYGHKDMQQWMLDSLPTPSKREKKELKKRGVEARRTGVKSALITTKSGYERKQDSRKRDMKDAKSHKLQSSAQAQDDHFAGFSD